VVFEMPFNEKTRFMISCEHHDYIEIACTYKYPIRLTMVCGEVLECTALDTSLNEDRAECIKVDVSGVSRLVVLDDILEMEARVKNPHFNSVKFR
jgi:Rho-binding antiterminator